MKLRELEYWLVHMLPIYLLNPESKAASLCGLIELGLAEIQAGIRSERSFRNLLSQHILSDPIQLVSYPYNYSSTIAIASGSITEAMDWGWYDLSPSWSSEPQVEYV